MEMDIPEEKIAEPKAEPKKLIKYADDDKYPISTLALMRIPPLVGGLVLGMVLSFVMSRFEEVLAKNVQVAFFIPLVVYMASAVGGQTQGIYTRDLKSGKAKFATYLLKETCLGLILGFLFGALSWFIVETWFGSEELARAIALSMFAARAIALSMFAAVASAPLVALIITEVFELEHQDPAVGAGPIATVIQDTISVIIYGLISSAILLN